MKTIYKPTALGWWVIVSIVALLIVALFASCSGTSVKPDSFWIGGWHGETTGNAHRTGGVQSGADYSGETNGIQAGVEWKIGKEPLPPREDPWRDGLYREPPPEPQEAPAPGPPEPVAPGQATEPPAKPHEEPTKKGEPVPWVLILTSSTTLASAVLMALQKMGKTELLSPKGHGG